jgi:hypothetical protein
MKERIDTLLRDLDIQINDARNWANNPNMEPAEMARIEAALTEATHTLEDLLNSFKD